MWGGLKRGVCRCQRAVKKQESWQYLRWSASGVPVLKAESPKGIQRAASAVASDAHDRHRQDGNALSLSLSCTLQAHRRSRTLLQPTSCQPEILQLAGQFVVALLSWILQEVFSGAHGSLCCTNRYARCSFCLSGDGCGSTIINSYGFFALHSGSNYRNG